MASDLGCLRTVAGDVTCWMGSAASPFACGLDPTGRPNAPVVIRDITGATRLEWWAGVVLVRVASGFRTISYLDGALTGLSTPVPGSEDDLVLAGDCAVRRDGSVLCRASSPAPPPSWLGTNDATVTENVAIADGVTDLVGGGVRCALRAGRVLCWGGDAGVGELPYYNVFAPVVR